MKKVNLKLIQYYQKFLSPIMGNNCRFYPTCSNYTYSAIDQYGSLKGIVMGLKRIVKCHPFHPGGIDQVPCIERKIK